jgi:hypothetical protein
MHHSQKMLSNTWHSAALECALVRSLRLRAGCCPRDIPGPALFDFGDVELEEVIEPGNEFLSTHEWWLARVAPKCGRCPNNGPWEPEPLAKHTLTLPL